MSELHEIEQDFLRRVREQRIHGEGVDYDNIIRSLLPTDRAQLAYIYSRNYDALDQVDEDAGRTSILIYHNIYRHLVMVAGGFTQTLEEKLQHEASGEVIHALFGGNDAKED
jgi:hypothetical protein